MLLHFFCPANIYRPSLYKVRLGRHNPKPIQLLNLKKKKKKTFYSELYALQRIEVYFLNFHFHLFLKNIKFFFYQKTSQNFELYII